MTKRTEKTGGTQGANTEATALARLLAPLVDGMTTTRHQLLTWVQNAGLMALDAVFREEAVALAGPKGRHAPTRTHRLGRRSTIVGLPPSAVPNFAKSLIVVARRGFSDA